MNKPTALRHLSSLTAPVLLCAILPALVLSLRSGPVFAAPPWALAAGALPAAAGLALLIATITIFIRRGRGTIMPWDPPRRLITTGLYAHVRNPMILGTVLLLAGEAVMTFSWVLGAMAVLNFVANSLYFTYSEEPGLVRRFGPAYVAYRQHVPRWVPRIRPWRAEPEEANHE